MKSHQELIEQGKQRRADMEKRERNAVALRQRFIMRISAGATALTMASYLILLLAWHETWWYVLLSGLPGFLAGSVIANLGGGILRSMLIYGACQTAYFLLGYWLSGWSFDGGGLGAMGALIWTFMFIISWPVIGGLLGYLCESFELDHAQI